ncbi:hypothetical protein CBOM_04037 [Ceraceosorus bombacis]|uniref:Uncharacterized protein n=1 Tax=Ceraceosorus bombacis TaxID=401625 RepID=A0A0P1BML9_9BASI|nr:hypothetical protein CBOM_04037 [Ceraceosorus bombacis]
MGASAESPARGPPHVRQVKRVWWTLPCILLFGIAYTYQSTWSDRWLNIVRSAKAPAVAPHQPMSAGVSYADTIGRADSALLDAVGVDLESSEKCLAPLSTNQSSEAPNFRGQAPPLRPRVVLSILQRRAGAEDSPALFKAIHNTQGNSEAPIFSGGERVAGPLPLVKESQHIVGPDGSVFSSRKPYNQLAPSSQYKFKKRLTLLQMQKDGIPEPPLINGKRPHGWLRAFPDPSPDMVGASIAGRPRAVRKLPSGEEPSARRRRPGRDKSEALSVSSQWRQMNPERTKQARENRKRAQQAGIPLKRGAPRKPLDQLTRASILRRVREAQAGKAPWPQLPGTGSESVSGGSTPSRDAGGLLGNSGKTHASSDPSPAVSHSASVNMESTTHSGRSGYSPNKSNSLHVSTEQAPSHTLEPAHATSEHTATPRTLHRHLSMLEAELHQPATSPHHVQEHAGHARLHDLMTDLAHTLRNTPSAHDDWTHALLADLHPRGLSGELGEAVVGAASEHVSPALPSKGAGSRGGLSTTAKYFQANPEKYQAALKRERDRRRLMSDVTGAKRGRPFRPWDQLSPQQKKRRIQKTLMYDADTNLANRFSQEKVRSVLSDFQTALHGPAHPTSDAHTSPDHLIQAHAAEAIQGHTLTGPRPAGFNGESHLEGYRGQLEESNGKGAGVRAPEAATHAEEAVRPISTSASSSEKGHQHPDRYKEMHARAGAYRRPKYGPRNKRGPRSAATPLQHLSRSGLQYRLEKLQSVEAQSRVAPNAPSIQQPVVSLPVVQGHKYAKTFQELSSGGQTYRKQRFEFLQKVNKLKGLNPSLGETSGKTSSGTSGASQQSHSWSSTTSAQPDSPRHAPNTHALQRRTASQDIWSLAGDLVSRGEAEDLVRQLASNPNVRRLDVLSAAGPQAGAHLRTASAELVREGSAEGTLTARPSAFVPYGRPVGNVVEDTPRLQGSGLSTSRNFGHVPTLPSTESNSPLAPPPSAPMTPPENPASRERPYGIMYGDSPNYKAPLRKHLRKPDSELTSPYRKLRADEAAYQAHLARVRDRRREKEIEALGGPPARKLPRGRLPKPEGEPLTRSAQYYREHPDLRAKVSERRRIAYRKKKLEKAAAINKPSGEGSSTTRLDGADHASSARPEESGQFRRDSILPPRPTPRAASGRQTSSIVATAEPRRASSIRRRSPSPGPPLPHFDGSAGAVTSDLASALRAADSSAASGLEVSSRGHGRESGPAKTLTEGKGTEQKAERPFMIGIPRFSMPKKPYEELGPSGRYLRDNPDKAKLKNAQRRGAADEYGNPIKPGDEVSELTRNRRARQLGKYGGQLREVRPIEDLSPAQRYWRLRPEKHAEWNARRRAARAAKALEKAEQQHHAAALAAAGTPETAAPSIPMSELRPHLKRLKRSMLASYTTKKNLKFKHAGWDSRRLDDYVADLQKELHSPGHEADSSSYQSSSGSVQSPSSSAAIPESRTQQSFSNGSTAKMHKILP